MLCSRASTRVIPLRSLNTVVRTSGVQVISNTNQPLGNLLNDELYNAHEFLAASAFLNTGGLSIIEDKLRSILHDGGRVSIIHGADFRITDPDAIRTLVDMKLHYRNMLYLVNRDWTLTHRQRFHPKLYLTTADYEHYSAIVGSSNLTLGGLRHNTEVNVVIRGNLMEPPVRDCLNVFQSIYRGTNLIEPDIDFVHKYALLYKHTRDIPPSDVPPSSIEALYQDLDRLQFQPQPIAPCTQLEYVVLALMNVTADDSLPYAHLDSIYDEAERLARNAGEEYDWDTFHNSVRGRINTHTVGTGGRDLFERRGGLAGRFGEYRLSERGRNYANRFSEDSPTSVSVGSNQ